MNGGADAEWTTRNGVAQFSIINGGTSSTSIELLQLGATLIQGFQYVLQFDAWADQSRYLQAQLDQNGSAFSDYSTLAATHLTPHRAHYRYVFTMQGKIFLTGISLFKVPAPDRRSQTS